MKFTQFLFPNGRKEQVTIERPADIEDKASQLEGMGFKFEIENKNGTIWMSCVNHGEGGTETAFDKWCDNGPDVPLCVDELVTNAFKRVFHE